MVIYIIYILYIYTFYTYRIYRIATIVRYSILNTEVPVNGQMGKEDCCIYNLKYKYI